MSFFELKKQKQNFEEIRVTEEIYLELKLKSIRENKDFSQIIEELLQK